MAAAAAQSGGGGPHYAACFQCTQLCHLTHGQGLSSSRIPSFYSVLPPSPPSASLSLPIPPAFLGGRGVRIDVQSAPNEPLQSEVQLQGPNREVWIVVMQGRTLSDLAFAKGWERFVRDHGLSVGDLLLFKLLSKNLFSVTIYGNDGCEKTDSGTRSMAHAHVSRKRRAAEEVPGRGNADMETKRVKAGCSKLVVPPIIDIEDDEDDVIILSEIELSNAKQSTRLNEDGISNLEPCNNNLDAQEQSQHVDIEQAGRAESTREAHSKQCVVEREEQAGRVESTCEPHAAPQHISLPGMLAIEEQVTGSAMDTKEDTLAHLSLVELPPTPSNADKSNLPIIMQAEVHPPVISSKASYNSLKEESNESSDQETSSSDESDNKSPFIYQDNVKQAEKSPQERMDAIKHSCALNESLQRDRLNTFLAKDYTTEAFISKRRPVTAEEREKAFLAAKRFKSNRPHMRKLMKESHVYRGFWLSFTAGFASEHLPSEIQEATLLDVSGKAWSARWLGSRNGLSGGWRKFSLDHGLEEGDVCVFELMDKNRLVIKVHIFRVVKLKTELPGRDHYLRKPQSREWYISRKPSKPLIGYTSRNSSGSVKKMRGAIESKTTCNIAGLACVHTPPNSTEPQPETRRVNHIGRAVVMQLGPIFNRSEKGLPLSTLKVASNSSKEGTKDSAVKASKKYYTVERLYNRRKGIVEEEFLVELIGNEALTSASSRVKREGSAWWVPLSHFTKDKLACHL